MLRRMKHGGGMNTSRSDGSPETGDAMFPIQASMLGAQGNRAISGAGIFARFLAAVCSGFLLYASFPPLEWAPAAWVALVPLLVICHASTPRDSFKWGFLCGCVFWLMSISWVSYVTITGWFALSLYCALYVAVFSLGASSWIRGQGINGRMGNPAVLFATPALWTGLEFVRSNLGGGFSWNAIGISQYRNLALIQCADWGGVYAVSYVIVLVNTAVALTLAQYLWSFRAQRYRAHPELFFSLVLMMLLFWDGNASMRRFHSRSGTIIVAAVQPNIPQMEKWSGEWIDHIFDRLRRATARAIMDSAPDLVVWPETVVPDFVRYDGPARDMVREMLAGGVPLLVGSLDYEASGDNVNYYNSSFLFHPGQAEPQRYDKQRLVLFGEYIPLEGVLPFLRSLTPVEGSITPGTTGTVFRLGDAGHPFGVLICFEDSIARSARQLVRNGARLLINQTNDAWFDPSAAARQQMTHCVFRCVENRVAAVRATNTGITCFIDRNGAVYGALDPMAHGASAPAFSARAMFVPAADMPLTFYTRHGDVFAAACVAVAILMLAFAISQARRTREPKSRCRDRGEEQPTTRLT